MTKRENGVFSREERFFLRPVRETFGRILRLEGKEGADKTCV